jgi:SAM-dependent methyltransferase
MDFNSIDWEAMWQAELADYHWKRASRRETWDKRAGSFNKRIRRVKDGGDLDKDDYIAKMLARIETQPGWTVLDIGSGPGTLAIPLAKKVKSVTALDISSEMLKHLKENAAENGLSNIEYINSSWEDALAAKKVGVHDVVVASRSLTPLNIHETMAGVASVAGRAAYITLPVIHLPFDWEVYQAIGRGGKKHPPYIYVLNVLYQMGIPANCEILFSKVKVRFTSVDEAIEELQWRTDPFTPEETAKLKAFLGKRFAEHGGPVFTHEGWSRWALIWWRTTPP